jgi:transketolase
MDAMQTRQEIFDKYHALESVFPHWEKTKDLIDQCIDLTLNLRQSGHPGGARSKVHAFVTTLLSGIMRWDIRAPEKAFGDRFILVAGHTVPLVYATMAVFNEAMRIKHAQTGNAKYLVPPRHALTWEDLLTLRRRGGLPGHAEAGGKTMFLKFNTGPSGHGFPAAAGEAMALKRAGAGSVRVFALEGEGGLTPGASHETKNSAWGLGLDNLYLIVDWNDFGIDDHPVSRVVHGTPQDWFEPYGWRVLNAWNGNEWGPVTSALLEMVLGQNPCGTPSVTWLQTRKGRGYAKYDAKSHGSPHPMNDPLFWKTKEECTEQYGVDFVGYCESAPASPEEQRAQTAANLERVMGVLKSDQSLVDYLADRLVALGEQVPDKMPSLKISLTSNPIHDARLYDYEHYPPELYQKPGAKAANREALRKWGAWANNFTRKHYDRPLFLAASADLAASTNLNGFAEGWGETPGYGWYDRETNLNGVLLPQEITEFANSGIMVGAASVNMAPNPTEDYQGFYGACSTYGSFVYLKYGMFRLWSQMAQDSPIKLGKVLWVVGHSGPETADDSRTHFGIFSPGVTQLFPEGQIINLHPWEYNEVPVTLAAAFRQSAPIIALHLTRPPITIPDRAALGIPSHFAAAQGAYVIRDYRPGQKRMGAIIVQGTSSVNNVLHLLPDLDKAGLNVKIVAAISPELYRLQPKAYREQVLSAADRLDSMTITNGARRLMHDWIANQTAEAYSLSSDWDDRWRTGGAVDELLDEAHLSPKWILEGIERFVRDRERRLDALRDALETLR